MNKYVIYLRVSTREQGESNLGLLAQKRTVEQFCKDGEIIKEFTEIESGGKNDRPKLLEAISCTKKEGAKLIIARLDRLSRNVSFIANMMDSGVPFIACDCPGVNELTIHILSAVSQNERKIIRERTIAALQSKKLQGWKGGNPYAVKKEPGKHFYKKMGGISIQTTEEYQDREEYARTICRKAASFRKYPKPDGMTLALIKSLKSQGLTQSKIQQEFLRAGKTISKSMIQRYIHL